MTGLIKNLLVYPENMMKNLGKTKGLMFSQRTLVALCEKGLTREQAYAVVQRNALRVWKENAEFKDLLAADKELSKYITKKDLELYFDLKYVLRNVDKIFKRVGI